MQQYGLSPNWFKSLQNQFLIPKFPWADGKALKVCQQDQLLISNYFVHVFWSLLLRYQIWQKKPTLVELLWLKCSCSSLKIAINIYFDKRNFDFESMDVTGSQLIFKGQAGGVESAWPAPGCFGIPQWSSEFD